MKEIKAGGQALIEGVMMKGPSHITMAVRKPSGKITVKKEKLKKLPKYLAFFKLPFFRGVYNLVDMMVIGMKALSYSANESMDEEDEKLSAKEIIISISLALVFALLLFKLLPLGLAFLTTKALPSIGVNSVLFNLIDGVIKISLFVLYIILISQMDDIKRIFQYHGAEHKSVACMEAGEELTVKNARKYSTLHVRCGTSFILVVIILSIIVYTFLPSGLSFKLNYLLRIALLPVIAGISYEFLRISDKFHDSYIIKILTFPGVIMQKLTTSEPTDDQLEVGIVSLKSLLEIEGATSK